MRPSWGHARQIHTMLPCWKHVEVRDRSVFPPSFCRSGHHQKTIQATTTQISRNRKIGKRHIDIYEQIYSKNACRKNKCKWFHIFRKCFFSTWPCWALGSDPRPLNLKKMLPICGAGAPKSCKKVYIFKIEIRSLSNICTYVHMGEWFPQLEQSRMAFVSIVAQSCREPFQRWNPDRKGTSSGGPP